MIFIIELFEVKLREKPVWGAKYPFWKLFRTRGCQDTISMEKMNFCGVTAKTGGAPVPVTLLYRKIYIKNTCIRPIAVVQAVTSSKHHVFGLDSHMLVWIDVRFVFGV